MSKKQFRSPSTRKLSNGMWEWSFTDHTGQEHKGTALDEKSAKIAAAEAAIPIAAKLIGQDAIDAMPAGLGRNTVCLLVAILGEEITGKHYSQ